MTDPKPVAEPTTRPDIVEQAAKIANLIDWQPTCLPGQEEVTIVRQVLQCAAPLGLLADPEPDVDELVNQTQMLGFNVERGVATLSLKPAHEIVLAWVAAARAMLGDAPNYSETRIDEVPTEKAEMEVSAAGERERFVFTVQRAGKVTPHEARQNAEADRDRLKEELHAERAESNRWRDANGRANTRVSEVVAERDRLRERKQADLDELKRTLGLTRKTLRQNVEWRDRFRAERDEDRAELGETRRERDLALWLHAEAAWRVAGFDALTVALARINSQMQARIDTALALHARDDDGDCRECGVDVYEEPIPWPCATVAALQGDQPAEPDLMANEAIELTEHLNRQGGFETGGNTAEARDA